jgi:phosphate:Na+ symporter
MLDSFDEWKFLAGLGIFLFGMFMMEESIRLLAGRSFKIMIRRYTGSRIKGLISGMVSTAILQSSSAVSLMVLAFVGAGLMSLVNAIAVIIGAKVGTTFTAWIVAVLGFKFKIDAFAQPLIGIGGLGLIFLSRSERYVNVSKLCAAFGFLFLGLDFMKTSVEGLAASIDLSALPTLGLWAYVLAGIVLTAIMQSSSATIAVILTTIFSGIIDFNQGAAMVIGANVGTTVTILIASIGGIPAKKQVAISSLVFTGGTAIVALILLPILFWIVKDLFGLAGNPVLGIAAFHTLFNLMGAVIFLPALPLMARLLKRLFPEKLTVLTRYIVNTTPKVPEAAIAALRREIWHQLELSLEYIAAKYKLVPKKRQREAEHQSSGQILGYSIHYSDLDFLHAEIFSFYAKIQEQNLDEAEARQLEAIMRSSRSIMNATKNFYDLLQEIEDIGNDDNPFMIKAYSGFKERLQELKTLVEKTAKTHDDPATAEVLEQFFARVEAADKAFISGCSKAVAQGRVREQEVTRLLMANRFFTQSNRMLVFSMQGLDKAYEWAVSDHQGKA